METVEQLKMDSPDMNRKVKFFATLNALSVDKIDFF